MYVILTRNGWTFASQGCDYVVVSPMGEVVVRDMHKLSVQDEFMALSRG